MGQRIEFSAIHREFSFPPRTSDSLVSLGPRLYLFKSNFQCNRPLVNENTEPNLQENLALYDTFMARTGADRLQKILARYELFKLTLDVPGDIAECGVFKGSGIYTWVKLMRIFKPNNEYRVIGFDFFESERKADFQFQKDQDVLDEHAEGWTSQQDLIDTCSTLGFDRLQLHAGNVVETTKAFAEQDLGSRLSLLYIDVDNYEGALACLENLYPLVSPGGIVALDEYALPGYGESNAVDEYFRGQNVRLRAFPWANTPTAYLVKEI